MKYLILIAFLFIACDEGDDYYVIGTPDPCQTDEDCAHRQAECSDQTTLITYFGGRCENQNCVFEYEVEICEGSCRILLGWGEEGDDFCDMEE